MSDQSALDSSLSNLSGMKKTAEETHGIIFGFYNNVSQHHPSVVNTLLRHIFAEPECCFMKMNRRCPTRKVSGDYFGLTIHSTLIGVTFVFRFAKFAFMKFYTSCRTT